MTYDEVKYNIRPETRTIDNLVSWNYIYNKGFQREMGLLNPNAVIITLPGYEADEKAFLADHLDEAYTHLQCYLITKYELIKRKHC